jgi:hypothetical protein
MLDTFRMLFVALLTGTLLPAARYNHPKLRKARLTRLRSRSRYRWNQG